MPRVIRASPWHSVMLINSMLPTSVLHGRGGGAEAHGMGRRSVKATVRRLWTARVQCAKLDQAGEVRVVGERSIATVDNKFAHAG